MEEEIIEGLNKKFYKKIVNTNYLKIENCCNSNIFIKGEIEYAFIKGCKNCIIFICSVKKIITF